MNNDTVIGKCWHCAAELTPADYGRESDCRSCGKPTRVCLNCRWYAPERPNQCAEPMADRVMEKRKANFCGYFEATTEVAGEGAPANDEAMRQAAEDLFKF